VTAVLSLSIVFHELQLDPRSGPPIPEADLNAPIDVYVHGILLFGERMFPVLDLAFQLSEWIVTKQLTAPFEYDSIAGGGNILWFKPALGDWWEVGSDWSDVSVPLVSGDQLVSGIREFLDQLRRAATDELGLDTSSYLRWLDEGGTSSN
jgi:hypothetical protein